MSCVLNTAFLVPFLGLLSTFCPPQREVFRCVEILSYRENVDNMNLYINIYPILIDKAHRQIFPHSTGYIFVPESVL